MRIVSFNLNGVRAALRKGLADWVEAEGADVYCFQEIKIDESLVDEFRNVFPGYTGYFHTAEKKGYSGAAIYARQEPEELVKGLGIPEYDVEGRWIEAQFDGVRVINAYYPSGTRGGPRQTYKEAFMDAALANLAARAPAQARFVHNGDFNICHREIDIHHPEKHHKMSGFLPHEREWFSRLLDAGFADGLRLFSDAPEQYTWWTYRSNAREKNLGWRIDYHLLSDSLKDGARNFRIHDDVFMSDHCPITIELEV